MRLPAPRLARNATTTCFLLRVFLGRGHNLMDDHEKDSSLLHRDWRAAVSDLYHRDSNSREASLEDHMHTGETKANMSDDDESGRKSPASKLGDFL